MKTVRTESGNDALLQREADEAVRILRAGGILLYPTDTVWGIGCDATNADAVQRIYDLKRSENKKSMLVRYVDRAPGIAFEVMELASRPLTLILPGAVGVADNLVPDEGTLGVRVPDHAFCQRVLRGLGRPIVSTSANITGEATPERLQEVAREIVDGVDFVVNPRFEGKPTRKASSIIAFGEGGELKMIRVGWRARLLLRSRSVFRTSILSCTSTTWRSRAISMSARAISTSGYWAPGC